MPDSCTPDTHPLLFVYGTLKRGCSNHNVLESAGAQFVCKGATSERHPLVEGDYPYLLFLPGHGHRVAGEIYLVDSPAGWAQLDAFECHPTFYRRAIVSIEGVDGDLYAPWAYFLTRSDERLANLPHLHSWP